MLGIGQVGACPIFDEHEKKVFADWPSQLEILSQDPPVEKHRSFLI